MDYYQLIHLGLVQFIWEKIAKKEMNLTRFEMSCNSFLSDDDPREESSNRQRSGTFSNKRKHCLVFPIKKSW